MISLIQVSSDFSGTVSDLLNSPTIYLPLFCHQNFYGINDFFSKSFATFPYRNAFERSYSLTLEVSPALVDTISRSFLVFKRIQTKITAYSFVNINLIYAFNM